MDYPIDCSQKIDTPISVVIKIGADSVCDIRLDAGFYIDAQMLGFGNRGVLSIDGIKPDENMKSLLNSVPAFLRLVADTIEADDD